MKITGLLILCLLFVTGAGAQESARKFELGTSLITSNGSSTLVNGIPDQPQFEFMDGLFFRFTIKRFAARACISYDESRTKSYSPANCPFCNDGESYNKDFKIRLGAQAPLLRKKDWFYTFGELGYRNYFSDGYVVENSSGLHKDFYASVNGLNGEWGFGFKIQVFDNVLLSPELYYDGFIGPTHISNEPIGTTSGVAYLSATARVYLTARF